MRFAFLLPVLWLATTPPAHSQQTQGATFGNVIQLSGGTPSDVVLDELRGRLYLVNSNTNLVLIFDYAANKIVGSIPVGKTPLAGAISMDANWLYITCSGSSSLNVIDLSQNRVMQSVLLPSQPQGVEVGGNGQVLISMIGTGVVSGVPQGTLAMFDQTRTGGQQLMPVAVPALPSTPVPLPATTLPRPVYTFTGRSRFGRGSAEPHGVGPVFGAVDGAGRFAVHGRVHHVRHRHPGDRGAAEQ
jgi:hypothetical protein